MTRLLIFLACLVSASPAGAHSLFALVDTGELYVSGDQGATWDVRSALPVSDAVGLIAGTTSARLFLASASGLVYRSLDAGVNWTAIGSVSSDDVIDIGIRPDGALLVLTESGTLWASTDQGVSFSPLAALTGSNFVSLAVNHTGALYALTRTGEVEESIDDGNFWSVKGTIPVSDAVSIRNLQTSLYVLTDAGLVFQSTNAGTSWVTTGSLSQVHMRALTQNADRLAAITAEGEVASSPDGAAWTWIGAVNQLSVIALANDTPYVIGIPEEPPIMTLPVALAPPSPNPLRSGNAVSVRFELGKADRASLRLFDVRGREVSALQSLPFEAGEHELSWPIRSLPPGLYFLRLSTSQGSRSAKLTVLN
jgi:photosystem II stability/assembly factor-like uncharacterized protein